MGLQIPEIPDSRTRFFLISGLATHRQFAFFAAELHQI
jgi:hypothetical protein